MATSKMTPAVMHLVSARFKALGDTSRLQILDALRSGEKTVTDLVDETGMGQPNLSKHLQLLHALGFVRRRKEGLFVYYALADQNVLKLCDLMCGRVQAEVTSHRRLFTSR